MSVATVCVAHFDISNTLPGKAKRRPDMLVDLVRTRTADGIRLDGVLEAPSADAQPSTHPSLDAVICLSGVGSNFYGSALLEHVAGALRMDGITTLRVNTRGHDGVSTATTLGGARLQGAAYEIVDECRHDVTAWIEFLVTRRHQRVGLLGHSLGAIKALYAQAHQPHPAICRIVAISPPCLSHKRFLGGTQADPFRKSMTMAEGLIRDGTPQMLFQATFPFPLVISAATYLDKYGPDERYNFLSFSSRIEQPVLFVFGQLELQDGSSAFDGIVPDIESLQFRAGKPRITVVPDANHFYAGRQRELAEAIRSEWI